MRTYFKNGRILTGVGLLTPAPRYVTSLLVDDGSIKSGEASDVETVDLRGAFVMPGFNDAHLHLGEGARLRREVDLNGTRSLAEALARIAEAAARAPDGAWLTGGGWDEHHWPGHPLPTRGELDRVTGSRPAVFARVDVHVSAANSAALHLAGVTRDTAVPPGSAIDRDPDGEPTGILREQPARDLVELHIPPPSLSARRAALQAVLAEAVAHGITSVQDYSPGGDWEALLALHNAGELPLRLTEWLPFNLPLPELEGLRTEAPQTRSLRTGMLKAFLDGSLGARTAALHAPYRDAPAERGLLFYEQNELTALARERVRAGFQLGFHAIGDRALDMALTTFEQVPSARPRIEHAQFASPNAFARAREAGAVASMQPCHLLSDARWVADRLGDRAARAYAWRSFAAAGVPLAFGTDFPVEPLSPFRNLYAALTRAAEDGRTVPGAEQLSIGQALHACTQGAAYAENAEGWKGMLLPGYAADFIVLDRDPIGTDPDRLLQTKVLRTVVGGRTVFDGGAL